MGLGSGVEEFRVQGSGGDRSNDIQTVDKHEKCMPGHHKDLQHGITKSRMT